MHRDRSPESYPRGDAHTSRQDEAHPVRPSGVGAARAVVLGLLHDLRSLTRADRSSASPASSSGRSDGAIAAADEPRLQVKRSTVVVELPQTSAPRDRVVRIVRQDDWVAATCSAGAGATAVSLRLPPGVYSAQYKMVDAAGETSWSGPGLPVRVRRLILARAAVTALRIAAADGGSGVRRRRGPRPQPRASGPRRDA